MSAGKRGFKTFLRKKEGQWQNIDPSGSLKSFAPIM
jgi:hypothetical protein